MVQWSRTGKTGMDSTATGDSGTVGASAPLREPV